MKGTLLGSKLCSVRDITNRCNKANVAFYTYKNLWLDSSVKISECRKLRLYAALLTSVLLTAAVGPNVISNENCTHCNVTLTERIAEARWKMACIKEW